MKTQMGPDASRQSTCIEPLTPTDQKETFPIMPQLLVRDLALYFVLENVLGTPAELWLGEQEETPEERGARLAAAADILSDDPNAPGAGFLRDLLFEDITRPVVCTSSNEPEEADDIEWLEAA